MKIKKLIRKIFYIHNVGLKLLSLILACVLWFYLSTKNLETRDIFPVKLKFENLPPNLILAETYRGAVVVRIKGQKDTVLSLPANDFSISLDLSKATAKRHIYLLDKGKLLYKGKPLHPSNVNFRTIKIIPDRVEVTLEEIGKK